MIFARSDEWETEFLPKRGKEKTSRKRNRLNLQLKFREVGRKNFKAAKIATRPAKISCFDEKFLAQDIKTLTGEGTKAEKAKNRSGKGDCEPRRRGNRQEMNNC